MGRPGHGSGEIKLTGLRPNPGQEKKGRGWGGGGGQHSHFKRWKG